MFGGEMSLPIVLAMGLAVNSLGCRKTIQITTPASPEVLQAKLARYDVKAYRADVQKYENAGDADQAKQVRNRIVYSVMAEIDEAYGGYTAKLLEGRGATAVLADTLQLGLTAAATIAAPVRTKTILSAIATGLGGVNLSFDKNFFAQQTFQTLVIGMRTRRDKRHIEIVRRLKNDNVTDYPLAAARSDLIQYFYAGTLVGGLQELQEDAARATPGETP